MTEWTVNNKLNDWYQKRYHIKLPKQYETKARLYFTASYSPFELFSTGSTGLWLDPSDLTTMYQDAAGTTPVTTPGQPVGLRLDKSKGLALGPELTNPANWTASGGTISVAGGTVVLTSSAAGTVSMTQTFTTTPGNYYKMFQSHTAAILTTVNVYRFPIFNNFLVNIPNNQSTILQLNDTDNTTAVTVYFTATAAGQTVTLSSLSIKEVPGNHATQFTLASRPTYGIEPAGGRRNLFVLTEDFTVSPWLGAIARTANTQAAPNGTLTADTITRHVTGANESAIRVATTQAVSTAHAVSIYVKAGAAGAKLYIRNLSINGDTVHFDPSNGAIDLTYGASYAGNVSMVSVGSGWWRCTIAGTTPSSIANNLVDLGVTNGASALGGSTTDFVYIWGAQLELGSTATPYQRVTTAFDVTEAGVQTCHYVQYDGSDDGMITNSIDFTATDKMSVFAGVRKLSDAAVGIIAELSASSDSNNGTFAAYAPSVAGNAGLGYFSKGTVFGVANVTSGYASPSTVVQTGLGDISGDRATLRLNGTQAAQTTTDQGTGNYGNYKLNLGRRGNDQTTPTLPFRGRDYGIVVVGKATTATEITSTESWLAAKTGFYAPVITGVPTIGVS